MNEAEITAGRIERIETMRTPDIDCLRAELEQTVTREGMKEARRWISLAVGLEYAHPGLDAAAYMCHPLRVGRMYIDLSERPHAAGVGLAVLHNVLEVGSLPRDEVARLLGSEMTENVALLTVNRPRQWDASYKNSYYSAIADAAAHVAEVKVLDKLDNLYLLCLNPDAETRARYLNEIERWVLPLAQWRVPAVTDLIEALVEDNRRIGYRPVTSWELTAH